MNLFGTVLMLAVARFPQYAREMLAVAVEHMAQQSRVPAGLGGPRLAGRPDQAAPQEDSGGVRVPTEGCTNASALTREMQQLGYRGNVSTLCLRLKPYRNGTTARLLGGRCFPARGASAVAGQPGEARIPAQ